MDLRRFFLRRTEPLAPPPIAPTLPVPGAPKPAFWPYEWAVGAGFEPWFETSAGRVEIARVATREALAVLSEFRARVPESGRWPILLGREAGVELMASMRSKWDGDVASLLARADALDPKEVFEARLAHVLPRVEALKEARRRAPGWNFCLTGELLYDAAYPEPEDLQLDFDPNTLTVPDHPHAGGRALFGQTESSVFLATIPTANSWEAPAHLGYGGWNDYPPVAEHVAMLRHWHARHGAEVVALTGDVVELRPARPAMDPVEAKRLAREWFAYSSDNVYQGFGTLPELAQAMLGAETWFSWWD